MNNRFDIGEVVRVRHPNLGTWRGVVLRIYHTGDGDEYEVSNSPEVVPGFPVLCWEHELSHAE